MPGERTEKATPKHAGEARRKGQVAKSADLSGAVVLLIALSAFGALAPRAMAASMFEVGELSRG